MIFKAISRFMFASTIIGLNASFLVPPAQSVGLHNSDKRFTAIRDMSPSDWDDPAQIERTWTAAIVRVPTATGRSKVTNFRELDAKYGVGGVKFPTAIYMHGCSGIWPGTYARIKFLADNGFLVIAPASLARTKYPKSCDENTNEGGMYRPTLRMRQLDAGNAIKNAKKLSYVDAENILLIGLSEGGITAATFDSSKENQAVSARVIEGWTCSAGWMEYAGLKAPPSEPVLSLLGVNDPWFRNPWNKGHCGRHMNKENGSESVVYEKGTLANRHELLEYKSVQNKVLAFVKLHIELPISIRDVQQILTDLGFNPGPVDGAWGRKTLSALNALREKHGLESVKDLDFSSQALLRKVARDRSLVR